MTTRTPATKICKDCLEEGTVGLKPRPAEKPGPRCVTHHRAFVKAQKVRNHDRMVVRTYEGMEPGDYDRMYAEQGGRCAICVWATGKTKRLAVDHNHRTGKVRGLLCGPCNQFIGRMGDDPEVFERAAAYLRRGEGEPVAPGRRPNRRDPK